MAGSEFQSLGVIGIKELAKALVRFFDLIVTDKREKTEVLSLTILSLE